jgi:hypothetical protein
MRFEHFVVQVRMHAIEPVARNDSKVAPQFMLIRPLHRAELYPTNPHSRGCHTPIFLAFPPASPGLKAVTSYQPMHRPHTVLSLRPVTQFME